MPKRVAKRTWQEELASIDRVMRAISGVTDPEELVDVYWRGVGEFIPSNDFVSVSRRGEQAPYYLITRSSRFTVHPNPWTERDKLPRLSGGLLGEIAYGNKPVIIDDLPAELSPDDPAWFHLSGYQAMIALPQYNGGEGLNVTMMMLNPGEEVDERMIPMLHWQSGLFGRGTQNLVLRNQLASAHAALDREMQVVGEIQRSLLPQELPTIAGCELAAWYQASSRAGGDYYDFFPIIDGRWGVFIADVSGHGTPAAVLMAITRAILHAQPQIHAMPGKLMEYLNREFIRSYTQNGAFVTAFYAVLDPATRVLRYCSAGHNPPRLARRGRVLALDAGGGLPLGVQLDGEMEEASVTLEQGDMLLLYTDGISEAMAPRAANGSRQMFGVEGIDTILISEGTGPAERCVQGVREATEFFCRGAPADDDRTLVAIRCL